MFAVEVGGAGASAALCAPENMRAVDVEGAGASAECNPELGASSLAVAPVAIFTALGKGGVAGRGSVMLCVGVALLAVGFKDCAAKSPRGRPLPTASA